MSSGVGVEWGLPGQESGSSLVQPLGLTAEQGPEQRLGQMQHQEQMRHPGPMPVPESRPAQAERLGVAGPPEVSDVLLVRHPSLGE